MDSAATVLARESFTPFGARRGSNWQSTPTSGDYSTFQGTTRRGFTGHEMLDSVSLVHMNGWVYDPYVGRFLSPDPILQTLGFSVVFRFGGAKVGYGSSARGPPSSIGGVPILYQTAADAGLPWLPSWDTAAKVLLPGYLSFSEAQRAFRDPYCA